MRGLRSHGAFLTSAHGRWVRGRLLVSGTVQRKAGYAYPGPLHSHLDFIVLDSRQRPLSFARVNYLLRPIPIVYRGIPAQASYADYLPIVPPAGASVRVEHCQSSLEQCQRDHPAAEAQEAKRPRQERDK